MNYKGYSLSRSLNGNKIVHIARNKSEVVVFREISERKLKEAIDKSLEEKEKAILEDRKKLALKVKKANERNLFQSKDEYAKEKEEAEKARQELEQKVTRGADGKFLSKKNFEGVKKKSLWEKLTS